MGVRVRKLAKQLSSTPGEVLGLLHALGFARYRTPEDMVSDAVVRQVRDAQQSGVRAIPVAVPIRAPMQEPSAAPADLMSQLVPGVKRSVPPTAGETERVSLEQAHAASLATARRLQAELVAEQTSRAAEREALARAESERLLLVAQLQQAQTELGQSRLACADAERALAHANDALDALKAERNQMAVAPTICEGDIKVSVERLSEALLLNGCRRISFIGGSWHRLVRPSLDRRVEARFEPAEARDRARAEHDVKRTDVVVMCGVDVDQDARQVHSTTRAAVVLLPSDASVTDMVDSVVEVLRG
jgi:hypothetical protein